ncbi:MAG: hypothetical protein KatS3mg103_1272 [Phycisphaerales bacterium]|nr:MAG: hypothetical protein KatS3mg103_1272 [Phycisphaerales bacterium]
MVPAARFVPHFPRRSARLAGVMLALAWAMGIASAWPRLAANHAHAAQSDPPASTLVPTDGDGPQPSPAVLRAIQAPYLTDAERAQLRLFHGLWQPGDLDNDRALARAALMVGDLSHPALDSPLADPLDRAEAMIARGKVRQALALLEALTQQPPQPGRPEMPDPAERPEQGADDGPAGDPADPSTLRALALSARALELLGRPQAVGPVLQRVADQLAHDRHPSAEALTHAAEAMLVGLRCVGTERPEEDYQHLAQLLATVRDGLDRLHWPARLLEARLLDARDNRPEARQALLEALSLNPRCAAAWFLLGQGHVRSFNFDAAQAVADRLDELASILRPGAVSADAALLRAESLLRQKEPRQAAEVLDDLLAVEPDMRQALALRAAVAAVYQDQATADAMLERLEALSPGLALGHYEAGRQLADWRQYEQAMAYLSEATARQPAWPEPWIELGLLAMQAARDQAAIEALSRATELDPFNVRARNTLRLAQELAGYERIQTEHFIIRHKPGPDALLAGEMAPVLESIHKRVCSAEAGGLDHEPAYKTVIDLMPSHDWFAVRITGLPDVFTIAASTGPAIAMETPRPTPGGTTDGYDWPRVLQHEYVHTVGLSRTRNRLPHWFTEAQAVYLEDGPWDEARARLLADALAAGDLFPLDRLSLGFIRPQRPSDRSLAYAQSAWLYEFIIERFGPRAPLALMDAYAQGQTQREAFESVLGIDQDRLEQQFLEWAVGRARGWGLLPPQGVPSAQQLLSQYAADERSPTIEEIAGLLELHPDHPQLVERLARATLERHNGRPTEAMAPLLERWAHLVPVADEPRRLLLILARQRGIDPGDQAAIDHLEHLDARAQYTGAYAAELARLYLRQQAFDKAVAKAQRAVTIQPFDPAMRELAATIALRAGRIELARHHVYALTIIEPDRPIHAQRLRAIERRLDGP